MTDDTQKKAKTPAEVVDLGAVKRGARKRDQKQPKCPICAKPAVAQYRPFCSKRCADVDLGKWLNEDYRIPTNEGLGAEDAFDGEE